jgi:hypothetical protein
MSLCVAMFERRLHEPPGLLLLISAAIESDHKQNGKKA